jgi:uncharacterized protein (DUF2141 family)
MTGRHLNIADYTPDQGSLTPKTVSRHFSIMANIRNIRFTAIYTVAVAIIAASGAAAQSAGTAAEYTIQGMLSGYSPSRTIYIALYDSETGFRNKQFVRALRVEPDALVPDSMPYAFAGIPPGEYMIAAYQDCNDNGSLDMGMLGPREPFALYRPYNGMFAPSFAACTFSVAGDISRADLDFSRKRCH